MSKIIIIAAIGKNRELGKQNNLIWKLKKDMKFFKKNTLGHKVVMGYNTFLSIPKRLSGREEIVLTHKKIITEDVTIFNDFETLHDYLNDLNEEVMIIGGATIYKLFLPYADELLLTEIDENDSEADAFFPKWNEKEFTKEIIERIEDEDIKYQYVRYIRKENNK